MESISQGLGDISERGDDPLLHFYGDMIQEILDLSGRTDKLANKYVDRQSSRSAWLSSDAVFTKLPEFKSTRDYAGAINYIESCLDTTPNEAVRWRLEYSRQVYWEWSDRHEEALENYDQARKYILESESNSKGLADSKRQSDRELN